MLLAAVLAILPGAGGNGEKRRAGSYTEIVASELNRRGGGYPVLVNIEHSEADGSAQMKLTYGGERFDPFAEGDELSALIVKKLASETSYEYEGENRAAVTL